MSGALLMLRCAHGRRAWICGVMANKMSPDQQEALVQKVSNYSVI
jgi:hypothetical protein